MMGFPQVLSTVATFAFLVTLSTAVPQPPSTTLQQLSPRQDATDSAESPLSSCLTGAKCPGIYYSPDSCAGTNIQESIDGVGFLVHAARMTLRPILVQPMAISYNLINKPTRQSFLFRGVSLTPGLTYSPRSLYEIPPARLSNRASHG